VLVVLFSAQGVSESVVMPLALGTLLATIIFTAVARCNVSARTAIGTASALALPGAEAGTIGYIVNGWTIAGVPAFSLGFIHLPALGAIVVATVLIAPFDARASHRLPVPILKKALAAVHYAVTLRSLLAWA